MGSLFSLELFFHIVQLNIIITETIYRNYFINNFSCSLFDLEIMQCFDLLYFPEIHCRSYRWNIFVLPQFMELF